LYCFIKGVSFGSLTTVALADNFVGFRFGFKNTEIKFQWQKSISTSNAKIQLHYLFLQDEKISQF
jgi:hypothetical protein